MASNEQMQKSDYSLDKNDRIILSLLDKNCRTASLEIGKTLSITRQAVEYRIKRMQSHGVIRGFNATFNATKIGFELYKFHFNLRDIPHKKSEFLEYLQSVGNVYWFGESLGRWNMLVGLLYKDYSELLPIIEEIMSKFRSLIINHETRKLVEILQFPKMYFTGERVKPSQYAGAVSNLQLDELNYQLLFQLVADARKPISEIARELNSTASIVKTRLKKLETTGIINQYRISVDLDKIGRQHWKTLISFDQYSRERHAQLIDFISNYPSLMYHVRNLWSIELEFAVKSFEEYDAIIYEVIKRFPNLIKGIESLQIIQSSWTPGVQNIVKQKHGH